MPHRVPKWNGPLPFWEEKILENATSHKRNQISAQKFVLKNIANLRTCCALRGNLAHARCLKIIPQIVLRFGTSLALHVCAMKILGQHKEFSSRPSRNSIFDMRDLDAVANRQIFNGGILVLLLALVVIALIGCGFAGTPPKLPPPTLTLLTIVTVARTVAVPATA
jgi:hypothetical protein